ncbi:hypothetical protein Ocin01_00423 [Orchesella cincta]|uniref:Uncharacterized protein n=1 Tax=Orchesella cincta TaxID=48709 RepID=A0A1D2NLV2_ORCCI|nr:hypothetical protein Ocin01_00423 [Orchesella cincta]
MGKQTNETRGWSAPPAPSTPSTVTAQSVVQLKATSSLDGIGPVSTKIIQPMPSRSTTTVNLSSNITSEWKPNGLVRPHTLDNIYHKDKHICPTNIYKGRAFHSMYTDNPKQKQHLPFPFSSRRMSCPQFDKSCLMLGKAL